MGSVPPNLTMNSPCRHIVWITLEDTSPRFRCYGDPVARTPNVDRLAAEGTRYPNAFSTSPVCAPSRCSVITGVHACSIGGHHMRTRQRHPAYEGQTPPYEPVPPAHVKCFPEYLRAAGYYCTNNRKTDYQFFQPFTAWDECHERAHWRNRPAGALFFSVFNFEGAHESGMWPDGRPLETDPAAVAVPPFLPDTPVVREAIARHYDKMARVDAEVGRVLRELEEDGLADDTLVVLWSDHGEGLPRSKRHVYDSGIRVPLIVRWPGKVAAGATCDELVSMLDLAPTVLRAASLPVPRHFHGRPLLDPTAPARAFVHATQDRFDDYYDHVRAVRDQRYKYIRNFHPELPRFLYNHYLNTHPAEQELIRLARENRLPEGAAWFAARARPSEELYDCATDPHEMRNLAGDPEHESRLTTFRAELDRWQREVGDLGGIPEYQLSERMWPGGRQPVTEAPYFVAYGADDYCKCPIGGVYGLHFRVAGPALVQLHTPTQGASLAYRLGDDPVWRLYTGAFPLGKGEWQLSAKAARIGFKESAERAFVLTVS